MGLFNKTLYILGFKHVYYFVVAKLLRKSINGPCCFEREIDMDLLRLNKNGSINRDGR